MSFQITSPTGPTVNAMSSFKVSGTDSASTPSVEGVLTDMSSGQSWNGTASYSGWSLTFTTGNSILPGDLLIVSAQDTGTGDSDQVTYQQQKTKLFAKKKDSHSGKDLPEGVKLELAEDIDVTSVKDIKVKVTPPRGLPEDTKVFVYLCLVKKSQLGPRRPHLWKETFSDGTPKTVEFQQVDCDCWDGICVVASVKDYLPTTLVLKRP